MVLSEDDAPEEGKMALVVVSTPTFIQARSPGDNTTNQFHQPIISGEAATPTNQKRTLMPVNIKQIADAWRVKRHGSMVINNTLLSSVKVIGKITEKKTDEYKGSFVIEDCTGSIAGNIWFTSGRHELDCIPERAYAMVVGRIKMEGTAPEFQCYVCRAVSNFNDITHHHPSVIATHIDLVLKPGKKIFERVAVMWKQDMLRAERAAAQQNKPVPLQPNTIGSKPPAPTNTVATTEKGEVSGEETTIGLPTSEAIMHIVRTEKKNVGQRGVHIDKICAKLMTDKESIRSYIYDLEMAGELYTTVDGDHYAST